MPVTLPDVDIYSGKQPIDLPRYSLLEAAHNLRLPAATVRSWIKGRSYPNSSGTKISPAVIQPADPKGLRLSFRNLAELHVLSHIRQVHAVKLEAIRKATVFLKSHYHSRFPLLDQDLLTDGNDLYFESLDGIVNASSDGQMAFNWLLVYLSRIDRDNSGAPIRLFPFIRDQSIKSPKTVSIDPRVSFGRPCVAGSGVPTAIIAERHRFGDSMKSLAADYGRSLDEIEGAIQYESGTAA